MGTNKLLNERNHRFWSFGAMNNVSNDINGTIP
jgi:hypothetical protein